MGRCVGFCLIAGLLVASQALAEANRLSIVHLEPDSADSSEQLAVHWTGALPVTLFAGTVTANGRFVPLPNGQRLKQPMTLLSDFTAEPGDLIAVVDDSGRQLAQTALSEAVFGWQSEFVGPGIDGTVETLLVHNGELIVAGWFHDAGRSRVPGVARWNGTEWSGFDSDQADQAPIINGPVYALAIFQGDLVIGGGFTQIGDQTFNRIARWDGVRWHPLSGPSGNGMTGSPVQDVEIRALTMHNGELVAGGRFNGAGGIEVSHLARWNGSVWAAVPGPNGQGVSKTPGTGLARVHALSSFGNQLIVGGNFDQAGGVEAFNVARWDADLWQSLPNNGGGNGIGGPVLAMHSFGGNLIVAGNFFGDNARTWNGTVLGSLGPTPANSVRPMRIDDLSVHNGELIGIGAFRPPSPAVGSDFPVARWTGSSWQQIQGQDGQAPDLGGRSLAVFDSQLVAGGQFSLIGDRRTNHLATWDGTLWQALEPDGGAGIISGNVRTTTIWNGELVVGGHFLWAGSERVNHLARWDGQSWRGFEGEDGAVGINAGPDFAVVNALEVVNNDLVVAGWFNEAGDLQVRNIARYSEQGWSTLGPPELFEGEITSLTIWKNQLTAPLVALSEFGDIETIFIATFDGQDWSLLHGDEGTGFQHGQVLSLATYDDALYAGGSFSTVDGIEMPFIARYDGQQWQGPDPDATPDWTVTTMTVFRDDLMVGGGFLSAGEVFSPNIIRWNGEAWLPLLNERSLNRTVDTINSMAVVGDQLVASGSFRENGHQTASNAARYDGTDWTAMAGPLATGTDLVASSVGEWQGRALLGGEFSAAGGLPAWGLAHFNAEPSSIQITSIQVAGSFDFPPNSALVTARITGLARAPVSGKLTVESDQDEWCISDDLESYSALSVTLHCRIEYNSGGPRVLTAYFSASTTHSDSVSQPVATQAKWPTETAFIQISPENSQSSGQPFEAVVSVSSGGEPTGTITVEAGQEDQCEIILPNDRCTLFHVATGQISLFAFYSGDNLNQPSKASADYQILPSGLNFSPLSLNFGEVGIGQLSQPLLIEISNQSGGSIEIASIGTAQSPFVEASGGSCEAAPFVLANGALCTLAYRFNPQSSHNYESFITIDSSATDAPHVFFLRGTGVDRIFRDQFQSELLLNQFTN